MIDDLQRWLALEHEAVWLYGLIGGRYDDLRDDATSAWKAHRAGRDHLSQAIRAQGKSPVGPALSYAASVPTEAEALAAARDVEQRVASAALALAAEGSQRRFAVGRLRATARLAVVWGAAPQAFPGLDEAPATT